MFVMDGCGLQQIRII